MTLIQLIAVICIIILAFWANNTWIQPGILRIIINVILIIIVIAVLLSVLGLAHIGGMRV